MISKRLHRIRVVQKKGNWLPHDFTERAVERRKIMWEILLKRYKRKGFLHLIVTGKEMLIHYDNPKRQKAWVRPSEAAPSKPKANITRSWNRRKSSLLIATDNKWSNLIVLSKIKDSNMMEDMIRSFCKMITPGPMFRKPYKYSTGKSYLARYICQILVHPTTTCFDPWTVPF